MRMPQAAMTNDAWIVKIYRQHTEECKMDNPTKDFLIKKLSAEHEQAQKKVDQTTEMMATLGQRLNDAISERKKLYKAIESLSKSIECEDEDDDDCCGCGCC